MEAELHSAPALSASTLAVGLASAVLLSVSLALFVYRRTEVVGGRLSSAKKDVPAKVSQQRPSLEDTAKPRVRVLYGTQTGTAERFSKQLASELRKKYGESTSVDVLDLENYSVADRLPREKLVVLCLATYGDGEPTDNAADFMSWLATAVEAAEPSLKDLHFAVFGLGNKQYEHFNAVGKKAFAALERLGATPLLRRGDGDDDGCIDDDFEKWCTELHAAMDSHPDLVGAASAELHTKGPMQLLDVPAYNVQILPAGSTQAVAPYAAGGSGKDHHSPFLAKITAVKELCGQGSSRSCVHVELDITGAGVTYQHGDHVALHAQNSPAVVMEAAQLLGHPLDTMMAVTLPDPASGLAPPFPSPISLQAALAHFTDLLSSPRKDALAVLAACASQPTEAQRLALLAGSAGKAEYADYIARPQRSLLEVMRDFPSARPPLGVFFASVAPRLQPRYYSISSSPAAHPRSVHVTCAVVRETTPSGRLHEGVASCWLHSHLAQGPGALVPVFMRASHFKLPSDTLKPVVMVGPGTGLAPFRGFLQERAALAAQGAALGPAVLFFGCRTRVHDYLYEDELAAALKSGALTQLHVAFSRDGASKDYVQHHLEREGACVWELLERQGGSLYVCGDAKHMAKDVHRTLVGVVQAARKCSGTQAEAWVKALQDAGRYQRDVW